MITESEWNSYGFSLDDLVLNFAQDSLEGLHFSVQFPGSQVDVPAAVPLNEGFKGRFVRRWWRRIMVKMHNLHLFVTTKRGNRKMMEIGDSKTAALTPDGD